MTWENGEYQPRQERAVEKKNRLLDAARERFATVGYHGTHARDIAEHAGVATGSFYRYFHDKKAIFMALCRRQEAEIGGRIFDQAQMMREASHSEQDILHAMIDFTMASHRENKSFHREVLAMQISDPDVAAWTRERDQRLLESLQSFLKSKQDQYRVTDLDAAAELILYTIEEMAHRIILFGSSSDGGRLTEELRTMLARYLF
jgi:AcrR family transcriptional regulator